MNEARRRVRSRAVPTAGVTAAVVAAVGVVVGLRAILHLEVPSPAWLLGLEGLAREGLGIEWTERTLWPVDIQHAALGRLLTVFTVLGASALLVATLNALILLAESAAERRAELAVRSAVGARPRVLVRMLLGELRVLSTVGGTLGLLAGLSGGALLRAAWPAAVLPLGALESGDLVTSLLALGAVLAAAHVGAGLRSARPERAAAVLRAGSRTGADPMAIFLRKVLTAGHTAVAGAVLVGTLALGRSLSPPSEPGDPSADPDAPISVLEATAPAAGRWEDVLSRIASIPGIEAESLAAPGALVGLGVRDIATAECGNCIRGLMPAPLWNVLADHHAVAPGYFELGGVDLVDGRDFQASDVEGAEPVAVVNETFARTAFEKGQPIGKRVRVGGALDSWFTVVGVVEDSGVPVLGADESPKSEIYLSALQHPPRSARVLVRGAPDAVGAAEMLLAASGFAPTSPLTLGQYREAAASPLRWAYGASAAIALLALLLAAHGVYAAALQTTRRRVTEIAIRRALGARTTQVVAYVLLERLRVVAWGLAGFTFLGTLVVALLQNAAGLPAAPVRSYVAVAVAFAAMALLATARAAREATGVAPAALLD